MCNLTLHLAKATAVRIPTRGGEPALAAPCGSTTGLTRATDEVRGSAARPRRAPGGTAAAGWRDLCSRGPLVRARGTPSGVWPKVHGAALRPCASARSRHAGMRFVRARARVAGMPEVSGRNAPGCGWGSRGTGSAQGDGSVKALGARGVTVSGRCLGHEQDRYRHRHHEVAASSFLRPGRRQCGGATPRGAGVSGRDSRGTRGGRPRQMAGLQAARRVWGRMESSWAGLGGAAAGLGSSQAQAAWRARAAAPHVAACAGRLQEKPRMGRAPGGGGAAGPWPSSCLRQTPRNMCITHTLGGG
jgi:hypothetical protein